MAIAKQKISPCLWYDSKAEEAVQFYCSVFKNSKVGRTSHYPDVGQETHGREPGSVLTVEFELEGMPFLALNAGPQFKFNEAISLQVHCKTQDEIDYYWKALTAGGGEEGPCGWLKDKFGLSWQVAPDFMGDILTGPDKAAAARVMSAFMKMKKFNIAEIEKARAGK